MCVPMAESPRVKRTKSDEDRVEHLAQADGHATHVVNMDVDTSPWLAGTVVSAVQVQVLGDELSPADALEHGGLDVGEESRPEQDERDPKKVGDE